MTDCCGVACRLSRYDLYTHTGVPIPCVLTLVPILQPHNRPAPTTLPGPMATWVVANLSYSKVLLEVAPLEKQLDGLTRSLADSQARLGACQQELAELDEQVTGAGVGGQGMQHSLHRLHLDASLTYHRMHLGQTGRTGWEATRQSTHQYT